MLILTIRTDKPEAEIGLFNDDKQLKYEVWTAHRQLAETLHSKIHDLLKKADQDWSDITGIVCFKGPGSFTGLRIGLTVANALANSLPASIIASDGKDWLNSGIAKLLDGQSEHVATPNYGAPVHITLPKS